MPYFNQVESGAELLKAGYTQLGLLSICPWRGSAPLAVWRKQGWADARLKFL